MIQDFRFAFRQLLKSPGFAAIAILTLALAIGVNSAVFALINGLVLRPTVRLRPSEVVNVFTARENATHDYRQFSHAEYRALRESTEVALAVGLVLALGAGRLLAQILYQVSPADPVALIASSTLLASAALTACFLPARRATRVSPMTALRTE